MSPRSVCCCSCHRNSACSVCEDSAVAEVQQETHLVLVASNCTQVADQPHHKQFFFLAFLFTTSDRVKKCATNFFFSH